jgi:hypothetical protein
MIAASTIVFWAIYSTNAERGVFLILLLMAFLFGVLRLRTKSLLFFAVFNLAGYGWVIGMLWYFKPGALELASELLQWTALAVTLPWFAVMGGYVSGLRERLRRSNAEQRAALEADKGANRVRQRSASPAWKLDLDASRPQVGRRDVSDFRRIPRPRRLSASRFCRSSTLPTCTTAMR